MININAVQKLAGRYSVPDFVIEKDYFIELFLVYAFKDEFFKKNIIFRGGTALKKMYFEDYRFSEDIDFILCEKGRLDDAAESLERILAAINNEYPWNSDARYEKNNERLQIYISYDVVREIRAAKELKVDIVEESDLPASSRVRPRFIYDDFVNSNIDIETYKLETVIGDKMSRIISVNKEARDVYDLWYLMKLKNVDENLVNKEFRNKNGYDVDGGTIMQNVKNRVYKESWKKRLEMQIPNLPGYDAVVSELEALIKCKFPAY